MTATPLASIASITPAPSDDEVAAIIAAIDACWPKPAAAAEPAVSPTAWRFSGRWWNSDR